MTWWQWCIVIFVAGCSVNLALRPLERIRRPRIDPEIVASLTDQVSRLHGHSHGHTPP